MVTARQRPGRAAHVVFASLANPELAELATQVCEQLSDPRRVEAVAATSPAQLTAEALARTDVVICVTLGETFPLIAARRVVEWPVENENALREMVRHFVRQHRLVRVLPSVKVTCDLGMDTIEEMQAEARRLGRPVTWLVREAWRLAYGKIGKYRPGPPDAE